LGIKISLLCTQNSGVTLSFIHLSSPFIKSVESYFGSILAGALEVLRPDEPRRVLRLGAFDSSIRPTVHPQSMILWALARVVFSGEPPPLLYLGFLRFSVFPSMQGLPLAPLTFPGGGDPPPSVSPTRRRPYPTRWPPPVAHAPVRPALPARLTPLHSPPPLPSTSHG
jgi:hypothetical protein